MSERNVTPVTIVTGPPGAGKSAYVTKNAGPADIVIDLDHIRAELAGQPLYHAGAEWHEAAVAERDRRLVALTTANAPRGWFVICAPEARLRWLWAKHLGTHDVVVLETPAHECVARVRRDHRRPRATLPETERTIARWWAAYTRSKHDRVVVP